MCVVFVHVRVAVCRAVLTMASVMWDTVRGRAKTRAVRAIGAVSSCVGCGEYPLSGPSKSRISARESANTRTSRVPVERNFLCLETTSALGLAVDSGREVDLGSVFPRRLRRKRKSVAWPGTVCRA